MKTSRKILAIFFCLVLTMGVMYTDSLFLKASAESVSGEWIFNPDNTSYKEYIENFKADFECTNRTSLQATIKITWTDTIYAGYYDTYGYDFEVKCGSVSTGKKNIVPANTWANKSNSSRSKTATASITVSVNTINATSVQLVCYQYQYYTDGSLKYTETEKPGTVTVKIPAYSEPTGNYTLSYNANGGSGAPQSQTGAAKYTISSTKPTRSGYTFLGWSKSSTASSAEYVSGNSITISSNTTLYAVWKSNAVEIYNLGEETYSFKNYWDSCPLGKDGHCFGMSATSAGYYNGYININSIGISSSKKLNSVSNSGNVSNNICKYQNIQGWASASAIVAGGRSYLYGYFDIASDWNDIIKYVNNHNYDGKGSLIVSFQKSGKGGHATNFLRYQEVNGQQRIYIYDSNFPGNECYLYKDSNGQIKEAPNATFGGALDCICLRDVAKYYNNADSYDTSRAFYAYKDNIYIENAVVYLMDCGLGSSECYVYEVPANIQNVIIIPQKDNAEFSYLDGNFRFGDIDEDTYGMFDLSNYDGMGSAESCDFSVYNSPESMISIVNYNKYNEASISYRSTMIIHQTSENLPDGASVHWFKNGKDFGVGEFFTVTEATEDFNVQAVVFDKDGSRIAESEVETVHVKTSFFAKLIAFFRDLFGTLPVYDQ